jgi:uncharacterized RDD family membrane protein YckC
MGTTSADALDSRLFCSECGRSFPSEDLARFGALAVCADCKPLFVQRMREGVSTASAIRYGGFWRRGAALFIDAIIMMIVNFPIEFGLVMLFGPSLAHSKSAALEYQGISGLIGMALNIAYYGWFWTQKSATPGMMLMGVKVIVAGGGRISVGRAIARYFAMLLSGLLLCLGYLMAAFDSEKRALHDHLCNTRVVRV